MKKIHLFDIMGVKGNKLYYRENEDVFYIELALCADNYQSTHNTANKSFRCVGERFFGAYAYYELYTEEQTQIYMNIKTNALKRVVSKMTGWNFHSKDFQRFYALQKQLNANGWTTLDLT